jgi:asparagine synthase (glutamine-hydrolysing)
MCGLAGMARRDPGGVSREALHRMASALRHRGPDGYGLFVGRRVGLAHTRLSIIDVAGGAQPMTNEDGTLVIAYNGEVYNYLELRGELEDRGHVFRSNTDTEVLVHGFEEWGPALLGRLNGQFAFALYDRRNESVFLARDRFGVRPLFIAEVGGDLLFGSEVKALLATGEIRGEVDPEGLDEVFTFWGARAPRTPFRGVRQLEPGTYAQWRDGRLRVSRYYALDYPEAASEDPDALGRLDDLMRTGVALRLRADVPVGAYLSGGLDSSITSALAAGVSPHTLRTFSVSFTDPQFDESAFQLRLAGALGTLHAVEQIGAAEIGRAFPDVVRHAETPLVRTAPAPLFLLAKLARERGITVVLTGEGSDELFLGYDLFKEVEVRLFCLRQPQSAWRPRLLDRLYPYLGAAGRTGDFWRSFFLDSGGPDDPLFSHIPRFRLTSWIKDFYAPEHRASLGHFDPLDELRSALPDTFARWTPLARAAYLEMTTLLPSYLLSSQGDRMAMAHGVEGRFPFLDHRLFEFAAALPARSKLRGLHEKDVLRRWASAVLPDELAQRPKQPYRAPDVPAFFGDHEPEYVDELLSPNALQSAGIFDPAIVTGLIRRCRSGRATGFRENQALVAILSTQLWHREFCQTPASADAITSPPDVLMDDTLEPVLQSA